MTEISVPLRSRRRDRVQKFQKAQHVVPAFGLLTDAMQALSGSAGGVEQIVAIGEIVTTVLLVRSVVRALRPARAAAPSGKKARHQSHGVDWIDVLVAAVLAFEVWEHWRVTGHIRRPTVLTAFLTLALGLFHGRVTLFHERRRTLRVSDAGIWVGRRFFRKFTATWLEIDRIDITDADARIVTRAGIEQRISLKDLQNAQDVRDALHAASQHRRLLAEAL